MLKIKTAPTSEPITLQQAKDWLRVTHDEEDTVLEDRITSARQDFERDTSRTLMPTTFELWLDAWPDDYIELPTAPIVSVASVEYYDTANAKTVWDAANYYVDTVTEPGRIVPAYGIVWPSVTLRPANAICVTFTAGYADADSVPGPAKDALYLRAAARFTNREDTVVGGSQVTTAANLPDGYTRIVAAMKVYTRGSF